MTARVAVTGVGPVWGSTVGMSALRGHLYSAHAGPFCEPTTPGRNSAPALRQMDGLGRLAVSAAKAALDDASFVVSDLNADRIGLSFGTGYGCLSSNAQYLEGIRAHGTRFGNPIIFQNTVPNAATGYVSIATGIRGPNATFAAGKTAGAEALSFGREQIQEGWAFAALCGSADQISTPARRILGNLMPESATGEGRPFDRRRDGIVAREGACFAFLEDVARAEERGARIQAEIVGMGQAGCGSVDAPPLAEAIRAALADASIDASDVDLVVSSANGSLFGDRHEALAIVEALPERVPVTCAQARLGETVGAAMVFGLAAACLVLAEGRLPDRDSSFEPDEECPLFFPHTGWSTSRATHVLLPVAGDDGTAHALLLRRYEI